MTGKRLGRRALLEALGYSAALLPFLPLLEAHAASAPPRRLLFLFSSNGTIRESWLPRMEGEELVLSPILAPLERFRRRLLVVDGLSHTVILEKSDRSGHSAGMNTVLTGRKNKLIDPKHPTRSLATGISLDQHLAARLAVPTKLKSVECGVQVQQYSTDDSSLSYRGPLAPIVAENSPYLVFDRLFRGGSGGRAAPSASELAQLEDRKRIVAVALQSLDRIRALVATEDRIKVEAHQEALHSMERALSSGASRDASTSCERPTLARGVDPWRNSDIPAIARLHMDLLVSALACDVTRIGTIQFGRAGAGHRFSWLGPEFRTDPLLGSSDKAQGFHALAHRESDPESRAKLVRIHAWYASQLAYLLDRLDAIPEAGGTMLDNTLVVWINELGTGGSHGHENTPWVLAGNVAGHFDTGKLVSFPGQPHNRLLLNVAHAMGVSDATFGDPDYCAAGPLTGLAV